MGKKIKQKLRFVAIDIEGRNFGDRFKVGNGTFINHYTILWGASNGKDGVWETGAAERLDEGSAFQGAGRGSEIPQQGQKQTGRTEWLYRDGAPLRGFDILGWLCDLPELFGQSIFITFSAGYDFTQVLRDMPFHLACELQDNGRSGKNNWCRWYENRSAGTGYGIRYVKGKFFAACRFRWNPYKKRKHGDFGDYEYFDKITVFDTFGFFQKSFLAALKGCPGTIRGRDYRTILKGKKGRRDFTEWPIEDIKKYTSLELHYLCALMDKIREGLEALDLALTRWLGAGSIAGALMTKYKVKDQIEPMSNSPDPDSPQMWAHYAFFGGRIEMCRSGVAKGPLYEYDISSAYPAACLYLPPTKGGRWMDHICPVREQLKYMNILSMVKVRWNYYRVNPAFKNPPFFPLPHRYKSAINYPPMGMGIYMVQEIIAALELLDVYGLADLLTLEAAKEFVPLEGVTPFEFVADLFNVRAELTRAYKTKQTPYNVMEQVIKLGINSVYGKTAQKIARVLTDGKGNLIKQPPATANVHYAAAITAWTRARMLRAGAQNPRAIVQFATDGITTTEKLELPCPKQKTLGQWEMKEIPRGVYAMSGVYMHDADWPDKPKITSRGFKPGSLAVTIEEFFKKSIPDAWRRGETGISLMQNKYMTFGGALASEDRWKLAGHWFDAPREFDLLTAGSKRGKTPPGRHLGLKTTATPHGVMIDGQILMSEPSNVQWADFSDEAKAFIAEREFDKEQAQIGVGRFGIE